MPARRTIHKKFISRIRVRRQRACTARMTAQTSDNLTLPQAIERVFERLPAGVPFVRPREVGPILGISQDGFTRHCRQLACMNSWRGDYRFQLDDPQHVVALKSVIAVILISGQRVPDDLRPAFARKQTVRTDRRKSIR